MRLKNRNQGIPYGFKFIQPEGNFEAPGNLSFKGVVDSVVAFRKGNPYLAKKHNWSTDWNSVADEVDKANALRMQANPKWHNFIIDEDGGSSFSGPFPWQRASQLVGAVVAPAKKTVAGVKVLLDWLGSSFRPVPKELAEKRAEICSTCPQNQPGDWTVTFTAPVAAMLKLQLGIKNDLKLSTSKDGQLHNCMACSCVLTLKAHTPLKHILDNTDEATMQRLDKRCWILKKDVFE